jgi:hypothetical protein
MPDDFCQDCIDLQADLDTTNEQLATANERIAELEKEREERANAVRDAVRALERDAV